MSGYDLGDPEKGAPGTVVVSSHAYENPLFGLAAWVLHEGVPGTTCRLRSVRSGPTYQRFVAKTSRRRSSRGGRCMPNNSARICLYRDAYERFGRLSFDMWRACASKWTSESIGRGGPRDRQRVVCATTLPSLKPQ